MFVFWRTNSFIGLLIVYMMLASQAIAEARVDVYEYAKIAAQGADSNFKRTNDTARAYQDGKAVVYEYILAIRRNVTESELKTWRIATRSEVVPQACAVIKKTPVFNQGFHFRYRYLNREGKVLDDFLVNKPACEGL